MQFFVISQILAGIALCCAVISFQLKNRTHVLMVFALMSSIYSLHFYFLGQHTASAVVAVSSARFITSIFSRRKIFMYLFLLATLTVGWFTYAAWYNLIAIAAGLFGVIGTFQHHDKHMRQIMLTSSSTMAMHDIIVGTPIGFITDLTVTTSNIIGYYRHYMSKPVTSVPRGVKV